MSVPRMRRLTPFDPTQVAGCRLWLDAADSATIGFSSGSNVNRWTDKSGNGLHASNTSLYPTYTGSNLVFNGSQQLLLPPFVPTATQNITIAAVWTCTSASTGGAFQSIIEQTGTANGTWWRYMIQGYTFGGRNAYMYGINEFGDNPVPISNFPTFVIGTPNLSFISQTSTNGVNFTMSNFASGSLYGTQTYGTGVSAGTQASIGSNTNTEPFTGTINEIILYTSAMSGPQQQQLEGYLGQKWGLRSTLPGGHPGITTIIYPLSRTMYLTPRIYGSSFSPTAIAGCSLWLDAADATTITLNTTKVTQWNDKSVSGYNFTQGTSGNQPTYSTASQNTLNTITFTSANSTYLVGTASTTFMGTNSISVYGVFKINDSTSASSVFAKSLYGPGAGRIALAARDPGTPATLVSGVQGATQNAFVITSDTYTAGAWRTVGFVTDRLGFTTTAYQNGTSLGDVTISSDTTTNLTNSSSMLVGAYNSFSSGGLPPQGGYYLDGAVAELLLFSTALTTNQRQQVEGYLAWKWGLQANLPVGHLYQTVSPNTINPLGITRNPLLTQVKTSAGFIQRVAAIPSGVNTTGLLSFFTFDNTVVDSQGTITLTAFGSPSYVAGRRANAIYLANEANISAGTFPTYYLRSSYNLPTSFTVSLWFNPTNTSRGNLFTSYNGFTLSSSPNNALNIYITGGAVYIAYAHVANNGAGFSITAGTWYNATITLNNGSFTLYMNGNQSGSTLSGSPYISGFSVGDYVEHSADIYTYAGYLDDYRIYNRVLSGAEITAIYNGTG